MESFIEFTAKNSHEITRIRREAVRLNQVRDSFPIAWKNDRSKFSNIEFKGYQSGQKPSAVSGLPRLYYDRNKPFTEKVPFYNFYRDTLTVDRPMAYLIPQGWWKVIERLRANKVRMMPLQKDTTIMVEWYAIEGYESAARPYEGHHPNSKTRVVKKHSAISFRKGDFFIPLNQRANRFLVETLEPHAEDSYFTWNFFDPVLGQKEGFSSYVFEETAAAYLTDQPDVLAALEQRRATDSTFNRNAYAQLNFVYRNSRYFEPAYLRYPVYRVK
ncbi:MAG TPA: hypothetical protein VFZ78_12600, partial [Flavisolibacter sp.]